MKRIQVSEKIFAAIWSLPRPDLTTESEILENMLKSQKGRARHSCANAPSSELEIKGLFSCKNPVQNRTMI